MMLLSKLFSARYYLVREFAGISCRHIIRRWMIAGRLLVGWYDDLCLSSWLYRIYCGIVMMLFKSVFVLLILVH